jgi:uncharacterized membrane protein YfcA
LDGGIYWVALLAGLGAVIAVISSMAGIGGGVFMVPLFYSMGYPINVAVGTSKFVVVFISLLSSLTYSRAGKVDKALGLVLMASMAPGGYIGAVAVSRVDSRALEAIVGTLILYYSVRLLARAVRERLSPGTPSHGTTSAPDSGARALILSSIAGFLAGLVAGLTGTGGGALLVTFMVSILGMSIHAAVATSMYSMLLAAATAAVGHYQNGDINPVVGVPVALGALAGAVLGPRVAVSMPPSLLRLVVGSVLFLIGVRLIV